jgi:hypothetical protein
VSLVVLSPFVAFQLSNRIFSSFTRVQTHSPLP